MLTLPIFRQLAYISPSQFLRWLECEYRTYLTRQSGLPYLEQPSNLYAEIGTCFDAFVKEYIVKKRGMNIPALKLEYQLARIKNPSAIPIGRAAAIAYTQSPLIKEFLTAYLLKNGMRSSNHQCLISYFLKKNPDCEREAVLIQQMSFFRNRLNYYGEDIPEEFYTENKEEFEKIVKLVLRLIEND